MKIRQWLSGLKTKPPVISTPHGDVTESARHAAALNMRLDPAIKMRVIDCLVKQFGGDERRGLAEAKRRYPEAGWNEK